MMNLTIRLEKTIMYDRPQFELYEMIQEFLPELQAQMGIFTPDIILPSVNMNDLVKVVDIAGSLLMKLEIIDYKCDSLNETGLINGLNKENKEKMKNMRVS